MTENECLRMLAASLTWVAAAFVVANVAYCLWLLAVASLAKRFSQRPTVPGPPVTRFCLLIPAHDEELVISRTLSSVAHLDYPSVLLSVVVIADNCSDSTAQISRTFDNVTVLEREDPAKRGKGYALNWALRDLVDDQAIDTFVIVDADTSIDRLFLRSMDNARRRSPGRLFAAQGRYDVANHSESWRTALMAGALSLVHVVRPAAREFLGITVGLKGNGMCFDRLIFRSVTWREDSLTEDIDFTLDILEQLDLRVQFVEQAKVDALMPTATGAAESQRRRWENGRAASMRQRFSSLLLSGIKNRKLSYIDAAMDLVAPPLAQLAASLVLWLVLIVVLGLTGGNWHLQAIVALLAAAGLVIYVLGGFVVGGAPKLAYKALLYAPFYTVWKILLRSEKSSKLETEWIRTAREPVTEHVEAAPRMSEREEGLLESSEVKK